MPFFSSHKPGESEPRRDIEKRIFKRYNFDVPVRIRGTDLQGQVFDEDTFTINIGLGGADILSFCEYDIKKTITVKVHLSYPLGTEISKGDWLITGRIVQIKNEKLTPEGKFKSHHLLVSFDGILGIDKAKINPWADQ
jgi:hypothetical protein